MQLFPWLGSVFVIQLLFLSIVEADPAPAPTLLKANGGWCWYQDERAIIADNQLIFGSVSSPEGHVEVTAYDLIEKATQQFVLHTNLQSDDHNVPALLERPDGRILAVYSKHGNDPYMRWRITERPHDISRWTEEKRADVGAGNTYSNLFQLSEEEGPIYNFHRGRGWNPNYMFSHDDGETWQYGGRLLTADGRPYVKYASNHQDVIHFITTEHHPHDYNNSIFHGFIRDGWVHHSNGERIAALPQSVETDLHPTDLTQVFAGDANNVAWTIDLHLDDQGRPYTAFSVQKNQDTADHRYYYGRWYGEQWQVYEMAYAGSNLYESQQDYTGLVALDPNEPSRVFISTDVDPQSGEKLIHNHDYQQRYEIFMGQTQDGGASWSWTAITANSKTDNLRPIVPAWDRQNTFLLWLQGAYTSYTNYDQNVVGFLLDSSQP